MAGKKPHILLITTDEQHRDTIFSPQRPYTLPGLDGLCETAVCYQNAYSSSPVCLPARCTLMTGLYPFRSGCCSNQLGATLPLSLPNLFTCLKKAGYHTSMHGKCHFIPVPYPATRGDCTQEYQHFIQYYRSLGMDHLDLQDDKNNSLWYYDHFAKELEAEDLLAPYRETYHSKGQPFSLPEFPLPPQYHPDSWVGRKAMEWIEKQDPETPQFTWVSFSGPHYPMDVPACWYDRVDMTKDMPRIWREGEWDDPGKLHRNGFFGPGTTEGSGNAPGGAQQAFTEEYWVRWRKKYYANIVQIDDAIRQIINLARKQYGDNLMIVFTSDHGDMMGNHGLWGKNHSLHEDVIRIPLMIQYPGQHDRQERTQLVSSVDILPTILEQAGCELPPCDGRPLEKVVRDGGREVIISSCAHRVAVIRDGWKLCRNRYERTGKLYLELYHLDTDPHEFENLWDSPEAAGLREEMMALLSQLEQEDHLISRLFQEESSLKPYWYQPAD